MNNKTFSIVGYTSIFILALLTRIFYPYEIFEDIIVDVILFSSGVFIYRKYKSTYSPVFILHSFLLILIIYVGAFLVRFFMRILFIDNNIIVGMLYTIIDFLKIICLVLIYSRLCEDIKLRKIKKYILVSITLCFIITIIPLVRITFFNEFLAVNSMAELELWNHTLKRGLLIIQDFVKCITIVIISEGLKKNKTV